MTVVSIKTTGPEAGPLISRIGLSDGSLFSFNHTYLPPFWQGGAFFLPGKELLGDELEAVRFAAACFRTERAALRLVARAEQTRAGLARKLEHRGHTPSCIRVVISHLADLEVVSDQRYAGLWLQSRLARGAHSPLQLLNALSNRGIDRDTARAALKSALDFEHELALLGRYLTKSVTKSVAKSVTKSAATGRFSGAGKDSFLKQRLKHEGFSPSVVQWFWEENRHCKE
ncbi:MAG: recombination regulator RecX [Treponema sp.]|jgi:regulatory protein|nr:recombination regulator RecX [Treponema sp.]